MSKTFRLVLYNQQGDQEQSWDVALGMPRGLGWNLSLPEGRVCLIRELCVAMGEPPQRRSKIAKQACVPGQVYRLIARNIRIAVWDGRRFIGIRSKFGGKRLDMEYHVDDGAPHGTAQPVEALNVPLFDGELSVRDTILFTALSQLEQELSGGNKT